MEFNSINELKKAGFEGFLPVEHLMNSGCAEVPKQKGIYLILYGAEGEPKFLDESVGGHFKGRNPRKEISELQQNWVYDTVVLYVGKAGGITSSATLNSRLKQYMKFGMGVPIGHWGGRLIWQLRNNRELIVCWKQLPNDDPREIEKNLIKEFVSVYGKMPYANLAG